MSDITNYSITGIINYDTYDSTEVMFSDQAKDKRTYEYVNGIFG